MYCFVVHGLFLGFEICDEGFHFSDFSALALFRANERMDPEICGLLAPGAFAGMRSSAIARVDYAGIDFKQRGILTPANREVAKPRYKIASSAIPLQLPPEY